MKKPPLTPELADMKAKLIMIADNLTIYKRKKKDFQKELSFAKNEETKKFILGEFPDWIRKINKLSNSFRYMHIAYCELRGTSREKIEQQTPRASTLNPNEIEFYKRKYSADNKE